ncbi:unnamed protein product [Rotaria sordida]|uniref:Uncharacterized protein n=1 Tax=Rotaria sordida TaxID=392033 RepID=A0A815N7W4_9BILA|nr:unnamed protein product [Rotaria sordida]CAF1631888.1 unnamed protein product [Rotaria sordida]
MIHGMIHYEPQLISNLQYYRQAIIDAFKRNYPEKLFYFNESIFSRKLLLNQGIHVGKQVSSTNYVDEMKHLNLTTKRKFLYHDELAIKHTKYKTLSSTKSHKFVDCCVSFVFGRQIKLGLIRAIVTDPNDNEKIFVLLEDLIDELARHHLLQFKTNNTTFLTIPNIYIRKRSSWLILRSSSHILHKHSYRFLNDEETIKIIEYSNLKGSS